MKIADMYLCLDCDEVFEFKNKGKNMKADCPSCANRYCYRISRWLNDYVPEVEAATKKKKIKK